MKNKNIYLLAFSLVSEIGPATFNKISRYFNDLEKAWTANPEELRKAQLEEKIVQNILQTREEINLEREQEKLTQNQIDFIGQDSPFYPDQLKEIKSAPFILFGQGNWELLSKKQLAIVGTRLPTAYGKMAAGRLAGQLANAGLVITSGLARGVDSLAHQATLEQNRPTVAVLGSGLLFGKKDNPAAEKLMDEIVKKNGLVISEYPPDFPANRYTFPQRNRIISGLSLGVLVIEAGAKSGALITANYGLEQNREVFALPGNIFSGQSLGTNKLIQQGAQLVLNVNDILEALNFATSAQPDKITENKTLNFSDPIEERIFSQLSFDPITIDKIAKNLNLPSAEVSAKISLLEMKNLAKNIGGGMFIKSSF